MKKLLPALNLLKSKYVLSLVGFVVWISFFDRNDMITQWERKQELNKLEASAAYYEKEISETEKTLTDLNSNPAAVEKMAREQFFLKRPNEEIFIVVDSTAEKSN